MEGGALSALLPASLNGYTRGEVSTSSASVGGVSASTAHVTYTRGDKSFTLNVADMGSTAALAQMASAMDLNTIPAAALGTDVVLTTLDTEEKLEIRAGTQPGAVLTLRGKGVPKLRSSTRGDLHVHIEVRTPTKLDEEQEQLLRSLAALRNEEVSVTGARPKLFSKVRDAFGR